MKPRNPLRSLRGWRTSPHEAKRNAGTTLKANNTRITTWQNEMETVLVPYMDSTIKHKKNNIRPALTLFKQSVTLFFAQSNRQEII